MLSMALILAVGVAAWIALIVVDVPKTPKLYGDCDTSGCENEATVHYGLEEWYCDACDRAYNGRS